MKTVRCPTCKRPAPYSPDNEFRPFCSERCQTLDLGAWAEERYRVESDDPVNQNSSEENAASEDSGSKDQLN